jgi:hypothetical protein
MPTVSSNKTSVLSFTGITKGGYEPLSEKHCPKNAQPKVPGSSSSPSEVVEVDVLHAFASIASFSRSWTSWTMGLL